MKVKPHHILVKHQHEADDLLRSLNDGKSFVELAKKYSNCPSGLAGGSLGEVDSRRLDATFLEAFEELQPGEVSKPVRTQFGWHLIRKD